MFGAPFGFPLVTRLPHSAQKSEFQLHLLDVRGADLSSRQSLVSLEHEKYTLYFKNGHFMERRGGPATSRTSLGGCPEFPIPEAAAAWLVVRSGHMKLLFQGVSKAQSQTGWKNTRFFFQQEAQQLAVLNTYGERTREKPQDLKNEFVSNPQPLYPGLISPFG